MEIVFASNNLNKLQEINAMLGSSFRLISLQQAGITDDIPEPWPTLEENALAKASYVYERTGKPCFADDTGLEVQALQGAPGVHSARFAGDSKSSTANMEKLLQLLQHETNRRARFRTIIALIMDGMQYFFEGIAEGEILHSPSGTGGFGYDPVFRPLGHQMSFARMPLEKKNLISHRKHAVQKLVDFLKEKSG